jgi:hypothetical protein
MKQLDSDCCLDVRVWIVVDQFKILDLKIKDRLDIWIDLHSRQWAKLSAQL